MENENNSYDLSTLTGKNSDYVHNVTKQLMLTGKTDEEVKTILAEIVPQILEAQKNGILARNLLGTPTEFVEKYKPQVAGKAKKYTNDDPKLMIMDSILLLFAILSALYGVMMTFQSTSAYYGLTTLILSSIVGGLAMFQVYRAQTKLAERNESLTRWQRIRPTMELIGYMLVWIAVTTLTAGLPSIINPHIPGLILIVIALAVFGIRYLLKRKFNIQSAMTPRSVQSRK